MKTAFNHAYDIAFSVDTLIPDAYECLFGEKERIKKALLERIEDVFSTEEWREAISYYDDSYDFEVEESEINFKKTHFRD